MNIKRYRITVENDKPVELSYLSTILVLVERSLRKGISKIIIEEVKDEKETKRGYTGSYSSW